MSDETSKEITPDDIEIDEIEIDDGEVDGEEVKNELVPDVEIAVEAALKVQPDTTKRSGEEVVDMAEESDPDDVETPLDAILAEKTASTKLEDEETEIEEDEITLGERADESERIIPKQPGEFHCSACFLLLPRGQLVDEERLLCKDCA